MSCVAFTLRGSFLSLSLTSFVYALSAPALTPLHSVSSATFSGAPAATAQRRGDPLSLACRFFDSHCVGYIEQEDLEELFYMVAPYASSESGDTWGAGQFGHVPAPACC